MRPRPASIRLVALLGAASVLSSCCCYLGNGNADGGIHKIKHVIVIMQENRTFDSYFGTYPGAHGLPTNVCVPDPAGGCVKPYHDASDLNGGGPHGQTDAIADINGGKMDGFVAQALKGKKGCSQTDNPACGGDKTDVMGFHDAREIPNYWFYAQHFVLQDQMFEPNASWSLPEHLFMVSEWSAHCSVAGDPTSCVNALQNPGTPPAYLGITSAPEPDCENDAAVSCAPVKQKSTTPGIWNPLPYFDTVRQDGQLRNIQSVDSF